MVPSEIKRLRADLGWTLRQMAEYLHVSDTAIALWEQGRRFPDGYRVVILDQLRLRLDEARTKQQKKEVVEGIAVATVAFGLVGLFRFLFDSGKGEVDDQ